MGNLEASGAVYLPLTRVSYFDDVCHWFMFRGSEWIFDLGYFIHYK